MQRFYSIFEKHSFWLVIFLLVFIPLYPKFPLLNVSGTYVAIRFEDILIALTVFIWLVGNLGSIKKYLKQNIFQAFILFWLIGGLSLFSGIFLTQSVTPEIGLLHWFRRIEYMSLFFVAATSVNKLSQVRKMVVVSLGALLVVIAYGFGQIWLGFPVISTTNSEFSKGLILYLTDNARVNSTFAGHYDLAVYLSILLILTSSLFFFYRNFLHKGLIAMLGASGFILLGFTASRISFIAALVGLSLSFWWNKKRVLVVALAFMSVGLVAFIPDLRHRLVATITVNLLNGGGSKYNPPPGQITIFTNLNKYPESSRAALRERALRESTESASSSGKRAVDTVPGEPINATELGVSRSFGIRLNVEWPRAMNAFMKNPFLGTGYSSLTIATDNDYLRSLGEVGILGTTSLGLIFLILVKRMLTFLNKPRSYTRSLVIGTLCSLVAVLGSGLFIDVLEASKIAEVFWLIVGITWGVMQEKINSEAQEDSREE